MYLLAKQAPTMLPAALEIAVETPPAFPVISLILLFYSWLLQN